MKGIIVAGLAALTITLASCSGGGAQEGKVAETTPSPTCYQPGSGWTPYCGESTGSEPDVPEADTSESAGDSTDNIAPFGKTIVYADGIEVTVLNVTKSRVRDSYICDECHRGDPQVNFIVKITNKSKYKLDAEDASVDVYAGANGDNGENLYIGDGLEGTISKGRSRSAKYSFAVSGTKNLSIEVAPDYGEHDTAIFEGSVQ